MKRRPYYRFSFTAAVLEPRCCPAGIGFAEHFVGNLVLSDVVLADLDGDRDLDLMSSHGRDAAVRWRENIDGKGSYSDERSIEPRSWSAGRILAVDVDLDGDLDVVATLFIEGTTAWYENLDGRGQFGDARVIHSQETANAIVSSDLDGDGDADMVVALESRLVSFINQDGKGTFGEPRPMLSPAARSIALELADIDGDGDMDCAYGAYLTLAWIPNVDGRGTFGAVNEIEKRPFGPYVDNVFARDIDRDGDQDLLYTRWYVFQKEFAWYPNDGTGRFGPIQLIEYIEWGLNRNDATMADVDGDGDDDLIVADYVETKVRWFPNEQGTISSVSQLIASTSAGFRIGHVVSGDIDGDGDEDVVAWINGDGLKWYENRPLGDANGDGAFNSSDLVAIFQAGTYEDSIEDNATFATGDWNADGDFTTADLIAAFQAGHYRS